MNKDQTQTSREFHMHFGESDDVYLLGRGDITLHVEDDGVIFGITDYIMDKFVRVRISSDEFQRFAQGMGWLAEIVSK